MTTRKTDWAVEIGTGLILFVVCSMAVMLFWLLALKHICGVGKLWPVIVFVGLVIFGIRVIGVVGSLARARLTRPRPRPIREGRCIKEGVKSGGINEGPTGTKPPPPPPTRSGLTAADALLAVVEATGNKYHPDMTLEDVCNFVSMVCNSAVKTSGEGGVYYKNNPDDGEVWSLMVVPPVIEGDDLPKPEPKYGRCEYCGNGSTNEACSVCGRPGEDA